MTNLSLKIKAAEKIIIEEYIKNNGKIFISFSGGKDSTILMHIAKRLFPNIKIVFSNTTNELIEVIQYVKKFNDVIYVSPKLSFQEVIRKYGFPIVSKEVSQKVNELKNTSGFTTRNTRLEGDSKGNGQLSKKWRFLAEQKFNVTHKCCQILKKNPLEKWAKENDMKPVIALMKDESRLRQQLSLYGGSDKKIYPFLTTGWTEKDIWNYAKKYNIRFAECYYDRTFNGELIKARKRTGCEYCGFGIHLEDNNRFDVSKKLTPKRYKKMMNLENNGVKFEVVISLAKSKKKNPLILDLYGVKIDKYNKNSLKSTNKKQEYDYFNLSSTIKTKKCTCGSKNVKKGLTYYMNFFDSPDPITDNVRNIWIHVDEIECLDCNKKFWSDLHMFNMNFRCTHRLIKYVNEQKDKMNCYEVMKKTNLSFERLFAIFKFLEKNNFIY